MPLAIVNPRKRGTYWQFDVKVNQDVTLLRFRYYPANGFLKAPTVKRKGRRIFDPVVKASEFFKDALQNLCRERWLRNG